MSNDRDEARRWSRRHFIGVGVGAFVVATLPTALRRHQAVARRGVPMMGTMADLTVVHRDERVAQQALDAALDALRRVEWSMTRFQSASDIGRANALAAQDGVPISADTTAVLIAALRWAEASNGRFDPALGSVVELWDVANHHAPPPSGRIQPLAGRGFWHHVDVTTTATGGVVRFTDRDVRLDLGGIAKGHGVDVAVQTLRDHGVMHAIVNVGGDLYALGNSPAGEPWRVGIRSPHDPDAISATLAVTDQAVATSGDYAQFFDWKGQRFHHLMDPTTAVPRLGPRHSVTVQADHCIDADAAATATFGLDRPAAEQMIRRLTRSATVLPLS
jgi:FAD:protein FMN transferase